MNLVFWFNTVTTNSHLLIRNNDKSNDHQFLNKKTVAELSRNIGKCKLGFEVGTEH